MAKEADMNEVLIPLNSGHQSGLLLETTMLTAKVLIPLNSGHQSGQAYVEQRNKMES